MIRSMELTQLGSASSEFLGTIVRKTLTHRHQILTYSS